MSAALDPETRALIDAHGLRNGCLTTIAPAGSISLLAGAVSSGIEPVFAFRHTRLVRASGASSIETEIEDYAYALGRRLFGVMPVPAHTFVSAQTLAPADHLAMQAAAQAFIDSAISKTVNCPADTRFDPFVEIYAEAYELGCKGCTLFVQPGHRRSAPCPRSGDERPDAAHA